MTLRPYTKPHISSAARVAHLRARGLIVPRPAIAARKIDLIGYERLRIYFISRRDQTAPGRPFRPGTRYHDILRLYQCDMALRDACFVAVGQFELLFRNALSETLSASFGGHPYDDPAAYRDTATRIEAVQAFMSAYAGSKDQRALHYRQSYDRPTLPPIWTLKELLTFGKTVWIYKRLSNTVRGGIAAQFGVVSEPVFANWLDCLVDLRNICAHHDRLFNRSFQKQPSVLRRATIPSAPIKKLKALLQCLDHLLDQRGAPSAITDKVAAIIRRFPEMDPTEAGY
ncbi:DNA-binding protein [Sphingomonas sp. Leaf407]|uniref:Abi family protein n=1 Tax=unclassified Sphingomonas TaxID=196159 RepID=UPI0006F68833|nr:MULTISPECIES: Abi family protein [unclassified Sphingomonas]KQN39521.1 DNA-binding protein [Sphingomonas sp. Leaf42]KQT28798.1 DNA-binding protein [Sphingomonas sp. Leaf407]